MGNTHIDLTKKYNNVGVIDADLINKKRHRFPNLVCMKLSAYYKNKGSKVTLLTDFKDISKYEVVFIAKIFTDTDIDSKYIQADNVIYGGTGFFYDKAIPLPYEIEHTKPDYHLYDDYVQGRIEAGDKPKVYQYYTDYSIGFLTRGCFRQCSFCVNKNKTKSEPHSPVQEFLDTTRKYICLLDDNFFGCPKWSELLTELQTTNKKFQFKQGLDERLLTEDKITKLFSSKLVGDIIFAFDNIADKDIIVSKLELIRKLYPDNKLKKKIKFYVLCAYDRANTYDEQFWINDIINTFERIKILMKYKCYPYIMRYKEYNNSPLKGIYINLAAWCNQVFIFHKMSFAEFSVAREDATKRYYNSFISQYPEMKSMCDLKLSNIYLE